MFLEPFFSNPPSYLPPHTHTHHYSLYMQCCGGICGTGRWGESSLGCHLMYPLWQRQKLSLPLSPIPTFRFIGTGAKRDPLGPVSPTASYSGAERAKEETDLCASAFVCVRFKSFSQFRGCNSGSTWIPCGAGDRARSSEPQKGFGLPLEQKASFQPR